MLITENRKIKIEISATRSTPCPPSCPWRTFLVCCCLVRPRLNSCRHYWTSIEPYYHRVRWVKKQVSKLQSLQFYNNNCSASICVIYTLFGGLYAVAYTDVAQLALIILGLFMALPNIFTNDYVDHDVLWNGAKLFDANGTFSGFEGKPGWLGEIKPKGNP